MHEVMSPPVSPDSSTILSSSSYNLSSSLSYLLDFYSLYSISTKSTEFPTFYPDFLKSIFDLSLFGVFFSLDKIALI